MNDVFVNAAEEYKKMLNIQYTLVVGYKEKEYNIEICFEKTEFHHLAGLQYLNDIRYIRRTNRSEIFDNIRLGRIDENYLSQSSGYNKILHRLQTVSDLENFLDRSEVIFKFVKPANPHSMISADFILKSSLNGENIYFFIQKKKDDKYFGKSIFAQSNKNFDYIRGHAQCVLLYKEKINLITNEKQILYVRPSYKKRQ